MRATEFKQRSLVTTPRNKVNCANEVAVAECDSRIPARLLSVGAPASEKDLSKKTQQFVDRAVARVMAVDSVQNQMDCDDLKLKTNKKSEKAEITKKITNGERSSVLVRHPMASKESVEYHASLSRLFIFVEPTKFHNGASPTDAWKRSRPCVGSGNGSRMLRSQVPMEGVERKGVT